MNQIKSVNRVFLATVLVSVLGSFVNAYLFGASQNFTLILILSQVLIILPSLVYLKVKNINIIKGIRLNKINIGNIVLIILFTYLITPLMGLINLISTRFVSNSTEAIMNQITSNNSLLLSLFLIGIIPAILEEAVYRGIFYNEYRKVNVLKGIFLSGFLFGIIHGNFNQFSYAFAMGIIFALLIEATDSILSTMIVHFFINGTSVFGMYLLPKLNQIMEAVNGEEYTAAANAASVNEISLASIIGYAIYAAITTALAFIVFRTIAKRTGRWEYIKNIFRRNNDHRVMLQDDVSEQEQVHYDSNGNKIKGSKKLITVSLSVAIVICFVLMIISEEPFVSMLNKLIS